MTIRTITFDDERWQLVPQELTDSMIDTINGHIDADSDAAALWRDALIAAPEPPAQQPTRDLLAEATEQVEALERENHRLRRCVARLMARLTVWLDDDQFNEADGIMSPEFEPPAQQPIRSITLTGAQIRDLAEFVGLGPMRFSPGRLELETEVEISGPGDISDEAGKSTWFPLVACIAEYPEDGYIGLGDPLPAAGIGKGESDAD